MKNATTQISEAKDSDQKAYWERQERLSRELLRLAKSQGHEVKASDIRTVVAEIAAEIAADIRAGKSTMTYLRE